MSRVAAIACGVLCCLGLAWAMWADRRSEWRSHQRTYVEIVRQSGAQQRVQPPGLLEIRVDALGTQRLDRCTTCHLALTDRRLAGRPRPLSPHPAVPGHDLLRHGCTLCHQGNGRMLTARGAHGITPPAAEPRLELRYVQAACMRCHPNRDVDRIAPKAAAGRRIFLTENCFGCHTAGAIARGSVGPDLTAIVARRTGQYLRAALTDPTADAPDSPMPPFDPARENDLDCLVTFLLTLRGERQAYVYQP